MRTQASPKGPGGGHGVQSRPGPGKRCQRVTARPESVSARERCGAGSPSTRAVAPGEVEPAPGRGRDRAHSAATGEAMSPRGGVTAGR